MLILSFTYIIYSYCYILISGNNTLKQNTIHPYMVDYVYVILYNAAKQMFRH
jgi:hypothetical protein